MKLIGAIHVLFFAAHGFLISNGSHPWTSFFPSNSSHTQAALKAIYALQNPENCTDKHYLASHSHNYGHGSSFHMIASYLGMSIKHNRIMLYDQKWYWASKKGCPPNQINPDCYFLPLSKCQYEINITEILTAKAIKAGELHLYKDVRIVTVSTSHGMHVPNNLPDVHYDGDFTKNALKHWYGHALRYLMRPNPTFEGQIRKHLENNLLVLRADSPVSVNAYPAIPYPPYNTIAMFVRHSDKKGEAPMHPFEEYLSAAETLVKEGKAVPHIILGTDDHHVIDKLERNISERKGFTFYFVRMPRNNDKSAHQAAELNGMLNYTVSAVGDFMIGSHPNVQSFIVTTSSNFARVIHELISTSGYHPKPSFIDLQPSG